MDVGSYRRARLLRPHDDSGIPGGKRTLEWLGRFAPDVFLVNSDSPGAAVDKIITLEKYIREHAELLRAYARYTSRKASKKLMESAGLLDRTADRARDGTITKEAHRRPRSSQPS